MSRCDVCDAVIAEYREALRDMSRRLSETQGKLWAAELEVARLREQLAVARAAPTETRPGR